MASTVKSGDDVAILKSDEVPVAVEDAIERSESVVVVPTPTLPF
jgi:hypothetical protein